MLNSLSVQVLSNLGQLNLLPIKHLPANTRPRKQFNGGLPDNKKTHLPVTIDNKACAFWSCSTPIDAGECCHDHTLLSENCEIDHGNAACCRKGPRRGVDGHALEGNIFNELDYSQTTGAPCCEC